MEFNKVFISVGKTMVNSEAYELLKKQYKAKGYNDRKARFAAMGCMSGRSQGSTCKWYRKKGVVYFERTV